MPLSQRIFHDADQKVVEYDGSSLHWRVSAYLVIVRNDQILLGKNQTEQLYDIIGGGLEFGETIVEALKREAIEEAGAEVQVGDLLRAYTDWFYHRTKRQYYQTMQLFYEGSVADKLIKPTDPDTDWAGWVPISKLPDYPLPPIVSEVIRDYVASR